MLITRTIAFYHVSYAPSCIYTDQTFVSANIYKNVIIPYIIH